MAEVRLDQVSKIFADGTRAVDDLSVEIGDGELLVFVGPSGCGKSTVLRLVAGLEQPSAGTVAIGGDPVNERPPQARNVAMVFQDYALYPHMSVHDNLAYPLRMRGMARSEIERQVLHTADLLGLAPLLERRPRQLSGGQRQRVAMGRALVRQPAVFLMDEPLSNLDAKLRSSLRTEIATLQRRLATTTVYVTHDQVEALTLGHRVAVLREGRLQQIATPHALYARPVNSFVARFIGSPPMNLCRCDRVNERDADALQLGSCLFPRPAHLRELGDYRQFLLGLRPEALHVAESCDPTWPQLEATVDGIEALGHEDVVYLRGDWRMAPESGDDTGQPAALTARLPAGASPAVGQPLTIAFDPESIYAYRTSGEALAYP